LTTPDENDKPKARLTRRNQTCQTIFMQRVKMGDILADSKLYSKLVLRFYHFTVLPTIVVANIFPIL
jgi:hypothetical protein